MEGSVKMKIAEETVKRLTEDMLLQILARLPMKSIMKFRAVCKRWNEMFNSLEFRRLVSTLGAVSTTPAFLLVQEIMEPYCLLRNLWISTESSYKFHSLSLDFLPSPVFIVAGCKSLLCCSGKYEIYICNPLTKTWIELPKGPGHKYRRFDFVSLAFDICLTCCTLILGSNSTVDSDSVVEMYDSKTNKWTLLEIPAGDVIRPLGEGVYSSGKFHWLNDVHDGQRFSLVTFGGDKRQWNTIEGPLRFRAELLLKCYIPVQHIIKVTGCEGNIVVVCDYIWTLNADEAEGEKWSKAFHDDYVMTSTDIPVNESGCGLAFDILARNVAVSSYEGNLLQRIEFDELADTPSSEYKNSLISVRAFQVNNIWWP